MGGKAKSLIKSVLPSAVGLALGPVGFGLMTAANAGWAAGALGAGLGASGGGGLKGAALGAATGYFGAQPGSLLGTATQVAQTGTLAPLASLGSGNLLGAGIGGLAGAIKGGLGGAIGGAVTGDAMTTAGSTAVDWLSGAMGGGGTSIGGGDSGLGFKAPGGSNTGQGFVLDTADKVGFSARGGSFGGATPSFADSLPGAIGSFGNKMGTQIATNLGMALVDKLTAPSAPDMSSAYAPGATGGMSAPQPATLGGGGISAFNMERAAPGAPVNANLGDSQPFITGTPNAPGMPSGSTGAINLRPTRMSTGKNTGVFQ
jgi:hypothetical protein